MKLSTHHQLRLQLHENEDGLTINKLALKTNLSKRGILTSLRNMPDAYIDRWTAANFQLPSQSIWCVVVPPEHCPKPRATK